jgi:hypothetical protein
MSKPLFSRVIHPGALAVSALSPGACQITQADPLGGSGPPAAVILNRDDSGAVLNALAAFLAIGDNSAPGDPVEFKSGPDVITAKRFPGYLSFSGVGPRGGYVVGPGSISAADFPRLVALMVPGAADVAPAAEDADGAELRAALALLDKIAAEPAGLGYRNQAREAALGLRLFYCTGCGRESSDCSAAPCEGVRRDRGDEDCDDAPASLAFRELPATIAERGDLDDADPVEPCAVLGCDRSGPGGICDECLPGVIA